MINYSWNFDPLTCYTHQDGYENVVCNIRWHLTGTSGSYTANIANTQDFTFNPTSGSFIPFNELTLEQVQSWVETALGEEYITQLSASVQQQIEEKMVPKIVNLRAPWMPAVTRPV